MIRNLSETLIDAFAADGAVDFFTAFCEPLPSQIFLSQLGLPLDDVPFLLWVKNGIIRPTDVEHSRRRGRSSSSTSTPSSTVGRRSPSRATT